MFSFQIDNDLELRLLQMEHAERLFLQVDKNRNYLREWLPWVDGTLSVEQVKEFIRSTHQQYVNNNGFQAGIFYKSNIVGCIGLHEINWNSKKTSVGYWLAADYQGNGIMSRSCRAIINYMLKEVKLNRIEIRAAEFNHKSRAIPERLGFVQEGISRQDDWLNDHYVDYVIYGLLAKDWQ
ncbi:MAG: GNAT family protein [Paenibacillaceae bacterium]